MENIFPLFALIFLGTLLKVTGITNEGFLNTSDRLVYFIFFPLMLFWKIGSASGNAALNTGLCLSGIIALAAVSSLTLLVIQRASLPRFQAGSFSQASYRFNTYIGMAIVWHLLGEPGVIRFGLLVGVLIPMINVMAVSVLIWYSDQDLSLGMRVLFFIRALVSNPLILGCVAGFLMARTGFAFPRAVNNTLSLMTSVTLPLALISIGGTLSFTGVATHMKVSLAAAGLKLLVLPTLGFLLLKAFQVTGIPFKTGMIFFSLPTSTAIYLLSAQLNSDTELASVTIMVSTLVSMLSLAVALLL